MKKIITLLAIVFSVQFATAQLHMGLHSDNYAGIYNINFQPADIVDSRYRFDMNIFETEFSFANNYLGLRKAALLETDKFGNYTAFEDPDFTDNYLKERLNGNVKKLNLNSNTMLPLSFFFQFGKNMKNAFAFSSRVRYNLDVAGVDERFARQAFSGLEIADLYNVGIQNKNLSVQTSAWAEVGLTYGREIIDLGEHYVKGAFTGKLNQGIMNAYVFSDNLDITFPSDSTVSVANSDVDYGTSVNYKDLNDNTYIEDNFKFSPHFSADIGFVYEWRPDVDNYKYELDGNPDKLDPKKNKYKLKASLAFTDIGFLRFDRNPGSRKVSANFNDITTEELGDIVENFENDGVISINDEFLNSPNTLGTTSSAGPAKYSVRLPFKINAAVDYHIWKSFYVNATASISPRFAKDKNKIHELSQYSITPRFEHRWVGVQLPLSMDGLGKPHVGAGVRLGPVVFGMNDIIPFMAGKNYHISGTNFYVGAKIPIFARIKDRDKDHVSNKMDKCKKDAGTWASLGCPDTDGDGITDDVDECPEVKGTLALKGCPDTDKDGDGISDDEDACPEIAGIEAFNGCPDTDEDGIKDSEDDCPNVAGILEFKGCPDTDGDGVQDSEDNCPEVKGTIENRGCPFKDTDGDGVKDTEDKCPEVKGPAANDGCPYADTDKDGVLDKDDKCINQAGPASNEGCPELKEEEKEALQIAFDNLQFVTSKSIIKPVSYTSLQNLATIMKNNPSYKLKVTGHTDSVGSAESNLVLSQSRAQAVQTHLVGKGVEKSKIILEGKGETMPIASNETAEGRQKNRRVELELLTK